jgi:hypothetical protein
MKYAIEMALGGIIHISSFVKISSDLQLLEGIHTDRHTHRQQGDLISLLLFFQNKASTLNIQTSRENHGCVSLVMDFFIHYCPKTHIKLSMK